MRQSFGWSTMTICVTTGLLAAGCGSDSKGTQSVDEGKPLFVIKSFIAPSGPAGQYTIRTTGGKGTAGAGGAGGSVTLKMDKGTLGGHIKVFKTGKADADWQFPAQVAIYLGDHPLTISADTTIALPYAAGDDSAVAEGEAHLHQGSTALSVRTSGSDVTVTGVEIAVGATLAFSGTTQFQLANDLHNSGTITTTLIGSTQDRGGLTVTCGTFLGESSSSISLIGGTGGAGGALSVTAGTAAHGVLLNRGAIDTSGGAGDSGGNAGSVALQGAVGLRNQGSVNAKGGAGQTGNGGNGGSITFTAAEGDLFNSGTLNTSGGDGALYGGDALPASATTAISLVASHIGDLRNSGALTANGGSAAPSCTTGCQGGKGGPVTISIHGGDLAHSAAISTRGGSGAAGTGGNGGDIGFGGSAASGWAGTNQPPGDITVSGNLDTTGGDGSGGGKGGKVTVTNDANGAPLNQEVIFYGYTTIATKGGDGVTGGAAGTVTLSNAAAYSDFYGKGPSGGVANYADLQAQGGSGSGGIGGAGGDFSATTDGGYGYTTDGEKVFNYGAVDLSGGGGTTQGAISGSLYLWGYNGAESHGTITTTGGSASSDNGTGGASAPTSGVKILSDLGPATNTAAISCVGGSAMGANATSGSGGTVEIVGYSASNTGAISINGGNANVTDGTGGAARSIVLYGLFSGATNSGTFTVRGGTGATDHVGQHGEVFIDGNNVTASWYTP